MPEAQKHRCEPQGKAVPATVDDADRIETGVADQRSSEAVILGFSLWHSAFGVFCACSRQVNSPGAFRMAITSIKAASRWSALAGNINIVLPRALLLFKQKLEDLLMSSPAPVPSSTLLNPGLPGFISFPHHFLV